MISLLYHDTVWMGVDRDKMNKAVFDALRHGGQYVVVDHSAPEGSGTEDVKTTHRIDELFVIRDVERAGFHHVATGDFLRNPADTRDWNDSPREAGRAARDERPLRPALHQALTGARASEYHRLRRWTGRS